MSSPSPHHSVRDSATRQKKLELRYAAEILRDSATWQRLFGTVQRGRDDSGQCNTAEMIRDSATWQKLSGTT